MTRKKISTELEHKLLYESQYVCTICQNRGCHIHHIDGNHSNDSEENLIVLCVAHHDEAHTKRQLSKNLDARALRDAKQKWVAAVRQHRLHTATVSGQAASAGSLAVGVTWGYVNHARVAQLAKPELLSGQAREYFHYCRSRGLIDNKGVLIKPKHTKAGPSYLSNSVYNWYEF